jgi:PBP1b-binding outer membrane lipoprotein LpoB
MKRYIPIILAAILLVGCASTRAAVPSPSESAGEYRELLGELYQQQADIAVTGQRIEDQSRNLVEDLTRLEEAIAAAPDAGETDRIYWLSQVQAARADAEVHQANIENLNRQLAVERETVKKQDQKFNDYEIEMIKMLSDKDTENAQLKEENEAVKGQRNTFLAILITAGVAVVLFIVFKVLRAIKIIPI